MRREGIKLGAARHAMRRAQQIHNGRWIELRDRAGWHLAQVPRIQQLEQWLREFRVVVVELDADARGQKRERLTQTFDMRLVRMTVR